jgi:glycosyltransferase involved in cell wall biosynthesis
VTVREAQILCKPCVITAYATAHSQIQDGVDGVIVENDVEGAADGIEEFLNNKALQVKIKEYLSCHHYGNEQEARKLEEL